MTFTTKYIECDFSLYQGVFAGGGNTATVSGLRISAQIVKAGGLSLGDADVAIYGLPLSLMNQLSTYGNVLTLTNRNTIVIKAGDDQSALSTIYIGTIMSASMDGQAQPEVPFRVQASVTGYENAKPVPVTTQAGSVAVSSLLGQMAQAANLQFENNSVDTKVMNPYYWGTAIQQIHALTQDAGIEHIIDVGTLAVWKPGGSRSNSTVVSPQTNLVAYPLFNSQGVIVRVLFDPTLTYGGTINVQSSITPACGSWIIYRLEYDLESQTPNGKWFCDVSANRPGEQVVSS